MLTEIATDANVREVKLAPGIGDILWIIMKLKNTGAKFHYKISGDQPRRGHQIFEILPETAVSVVYDNYNAIQSLEGNIQNHLKTWAEISQHNSFYLTINRHFENIPSGNLTEWLPDLAIDYYPNYQTQQYAEEAKNMFNVPGAKYVGCYGSSYSTLRYWKFWQDEQWEEFIVNLMATDTSIIPVIIGADWDTDMAGALMNRLTNRGLPFIKMISRPLGLVVEAMKIFKHGFYFPSGLGIIAGTIGNSATMFYPPHLQTMQGKWCDPKLTENKIFNEIQFCSPGQMLAYINSIGGIK